MNGVSTQAIARSAKSLFAEGPLIARTFQSWRPYICPFSALVEFVPQQASVLDIGCGSGLFLGLLAQRGMLARGVGVDRSAQAIKLAQLMQDRLPPNSARALKFVCGDLDAHVSSERFTVVALIDVIHHVPPSQQRAVVRKAIKCVDRGGILLYKDIGGRPRWRALANRLHDLVLARQWVHYVDLDEVDRWVADAGLRPVRRERINCLWYGHDLAVYQKT